MSNPSLCLCLSEKVAVVKLGERWSSRTCTKMNRPPPTITHKRMRLLAISPALYSFLLYRQTWILLQHHISTTLIKAKGTPTPSCIHFQLHLSSLMKCLIPKPFDAGGFGQIYLTSILVFFLDTAPPIATPTVQSHSPITCSAAQRKSLIQREVQDIKQRPRMCSFIL